LSMHSSRKEPDCDFYNPSINSGFEPTGVAVFSWTYMEPNVLPGARSAPIVRKFVPSFQSRNSDDDPRRNHDLQGCPCLRH
jgi:hypothetical protein